MFFAHQTPELIQVTTTVRHGDEPSPGVKDSRNLPQRLVEGIHVIEHPGGNNDIECRVVEWKVSHVGLDSFDA